VTTRDHAPIGAPCWADLWTSDVEGSRRFYSEIFGWQAGEPNPEFGGYFLWTRQGAPVAGGMGDMGDRKANNSWSVFLATDDIAKTLETAEAEGAQIIAPAMPVADLGVQAVLHDPTGAHLGAWQPGTFEGFSVLDEPGSPSWFELMTRDYARALDFYRSVFRCDTGVISDTDEFRYSVLRDPEGTGEFAGVMDASSFLPEGAPSFWSLYWEVGEVDATIAKATSLGAKVLSEPQDTPYGRMAELADPAGAKFKLRTGPR
jgi:uncharacterized protein